MENKAMKQQFTALFEEVKQHGSFNGVVLVAVDGKAVLCEAMGIAEYKNGGARDLTMDSMFELASVSKPITALGIIRLQQLGQLHWDDPLSNWIPELPYPGITIRHLLNHTSGLPDYMELFANVWDPTRYARNEDVLRMLIEHRPDPLFAPNESWMYSNTGYIVLAILIERISGQRYGDFLDEQIFQLLGMTRTQVYNRRVDPSAVPDDYAWGYVYRIGHGGYVLPDEVPELNYVQYLDGLQGDGMVNSTVGDLLRLDRALYDDKFISPMLRQLMFSPVTMNNGETFPYGMGWLNEYDDRLGSIVHHSGGWPGYSTWFKRYIDRDITLIMLQNGERDHAYTQQLVKSIEQIMAGEAYDVPRPFETKKIISLEPKKIEAQLGKYRFANDTENSFGVEVYVEQDRLYMKLDNGMVLSLLPLTSTRYYEEQTSSELEFLISEDGKGMRLIWYTGDEPEVAERVGC
ncbi:serine hydrolase [Shouchella clausii]|uniref:serine hydrolase n=1 Tax=Shouchella clausii TaxID=79880 RepID=UPI000B977AA8|nr:serine hydrolase [Shouchella clausii]AST98364.1 penicillin-binding protein 4 [Shouchella clausii]MCR1288856.1 serine hydrolase [Shouchella clausii]MEB5474317.1 serine hydrolase [Shouchella clausii]PAF11429.1 penicillin-binding protein 4 [Shouchella clausii]QNM44805.1 penicillin-binding protein 4 [Shouchella clausii]